MVFRLNVTMTNLGCIFFPEIIIILLLIFDLLFILIDSSLLIIMLLSGRCHFSSFNYFLSRIIMYNGMRLCCDLLVFRPLLVISMRIVSASICRCYLVVSLNHLLMCIYNSIVMRYYSASKKYFAT